MSLEGDKEQTRDTEADTNYPFLLPVRTQDGRKKSRFLIITKTHRPLPGSRGQQDTLEGSVGAEGGAGTRRLLRGQGSRGGTLALTTQPCARLSARDAAPEPGHAPHARQADPKWRPGDLCSIVQSAIKTNSNNARFMNPAFSSRGNMKSGFSPTSEKQVIKKRNFTVGI